MIVEGSATPDRSIEVRLNAFLRTEIMKNPGYPLRDDERLISGGLIDSFSLARIAVFVETEFGVVIPDTDLTLENVDTIDAWAARIRKGGAR